MNKSNLKHHVHTCTKKKPTKQQNSKQNKPTKQIKISSSWTSEDEEIFKQQAFFKVGFYGRERLCKQNTESDNAAGKDWPIVFSKIKISLLLRMALRC